MFSEWLCRGKRNSWPDWAESGLRGKSISQSTLVTRALWPGLYLNVDEDAVVGFVQHFVALDIERKLKGDFGLATWDLPWFHHLNVAGD